VSVHPKSRRHYEIIGMYSIVLVTVTLVLVPIYALLILNPNYELKSRVDCISYDPRYRTAHFTESQLAAPTPIEPSWIEADLRQLSQLSSCVRIYYSTAGMEQVPRIAESLGMQVILGVNLRNSRDLNLLEIRSAIDLAKRHRNVRSILVGNEVLLGNYLKNREFVPREELFYAIETVATQATQPVSTGETLEGWLDVPELVSKVDFIAINKSPYWAKIAVEDVTGWLDVTMQRASKFAGGKPIEFSEIGWPTDGPANGEALPGGRQFEQFYDQLDSWARKTKIRYNLIEAYDQPWKITEHEGRVGVHWGLIDARGIEKYGAPSAQHTWLATSVLAAILLSIVALICSPVMNARGVAYSVATIQLIVLLFGLNLKVAYFEYLLTSPFFVFLILSTEIILLVLVLVFQREAALILGGVSFRARELQRQDSTEAELLFVSIHVPCHNEPPSQVIELLQSLLQLDYVNFEIIVVDNNTTDRAVWCPVQDFCACGPAHLRFFHVEEMSGYKSGALNYALAHTDARAEIIGVVDADYTVRPLWLKDLVPLFTQASLASVQAPQAHRCWEDSCFSRALRDEYEGFFHTGMLVRDADNALVQHGSMVLMRRSALVQVGGWDTWCITEDTELGLRFIENGFEVRYVLREYGAGLVPADYRSYCLQRARWVQGAMQIVRSHKASLFGLSSPLSLRQRYHFLAGWLPWFSDILSPIFTLFGLILLGFMCYSPLYFPSKEFSYAIIFYVFFRLSTVLLTYRCAIGIGPCRALMSSLASLSLTNTIALSVLRGMLARDLVFVRTKKGGLNNARQTFFKFLWQRPDCIPGVVLTLGAPLIVVRYGFVGSEFLCWSVALFLIGLTGCSVVFVHLLARTRPRSRAHRTNTPSINTQSIKD